MNSSRVLIVNPNASERCSAGIRAAAARHGGIGLSIEVATAVDGPSYVETLRDELVAASAVVRLLEESARTAAQDFDAVIIACSSDPGVEAVRETFPVPVLGIGESALLLARGTGRPYGILTNTNSDEPYMWAQARRYGLEANLVAVEAAGFTVEDFDLRREGTGAGLLAAGSRAVRAGAQSLCLGCAAMAGLDVDLAQSLGVPIFEGVASAIRLLATYLDLRPSAFAAAQPRVLDAG